MTRVAGAPGPRVIGLDEISIKKGHTYRAVVGRGIVLPPPQTQQLPRSQQPPRSPQQRAAFWALAEESYRHAVAMAPPRSQLLFRRLYARALARAGRHADAQSQIEIALRYDPADPAVHLAMAEALAERGEAEQAFKDHQSAVAAAEQRARDLAGQAPPARSRRAGVVPIEERRAQVLERLDREQFGPPLPARVSLTYPYRLALGRFQVAQKRYGQAIPILEQLTQESLTDPVASFALGQAYDAYVTGRDPLQPVRAYGRILQMESSNPVALQGLQAGRGRLARGGGKA